MRSLVFTILILASFHGVAQIADGTIISKTNFTLQEKVIQQLEVRAPGLAQKLEAVQFSKIVYLSDGLKVVAYMAEPKATGKYPCIITNRGGNKEFGQWNPMSIAMFIGQMAEWGYVVVGSQYRGNDGGEGAEEFGGADVHDVLNLIPVLAQQPNADTSRMGIEGTSRGGMMTYLALKESCAFKAAVVTAGLANAFLNIKERPEMETVYQSLIPNFSTDKDKALEARSAVFWGDQLCKRTPLLIMHGSADWRVTPDESLDLVNKLYETKHPLRFILYEGADHGISEFKEQAFAETKRHFDYYVKDRKPLPDLTPHGR